MDDGIWSGGKFNSSFTPGPGSDRPLRGILSRYLDIGSAGKWSRHNAMQRLGVGRYILWTYVPSIVSVLYGVFWQIIDGEVKRPEKYEVLTRDKGSPGKQSLCLDYHSFWSPLAILLACRYRQWPVVFSSTGYVLSAIVVPNVHVFEWEIYSGGRLAWGSQYSWLVGLADPFWSKVLLGVLAANLACAVGLLVFLSARRTRLHRDPRGIASQVSLVRAEDSDTPGHFLVGATMNASRQKAYSDFVKHIEDTVFRIDDTKGYQLVTLPSTISHTSVIDWFMQKLSFKPKITHRISRVAVVKNLLGDGPFPWFLKGIPMMIWHAALIVCLTGASFLLNRMTTAEALRAENYQLTWSPNIYLIVGVFVQVSATVPNNC